MSERAKEPERTAPDRERRISSGNSQTAKKKRPPQGQRPAEKSGGGKKTDSSYTKRRPDAEFGGTVKKKSSAGTGSRKRPAAKSSGTSSSPRSGPAASGKKRTADRAETNAYKEMTSRDIERARRREERLRRVRRQKMIMAASAAVIVLSILTLLIFFLSPAKCIVSLSKGDRYARDEEYDKALAAYQEALEINENSVRAYRGIAGCLRMKEQIPEAEQILYTGWEKTKDKGILQYYNKLLMNDAVADINAGNCTQTTVDKLNRVLINDPENPEALSLMDTCKERLSAQEPQYTQEDGPEEE